MAAAAEDGTSMEPFSPSAFLELPPPTPCGDEDFGGGEDDPALLDDLVLPYISRMLMEEDIGDKFFYQYPDHPALLQAQQPFADILFGSGPGAAMDFSSDAATTSTTSSGTGSSFTLSPSSSSGAPAFANATWPYDPLELTQRLTAGDANGNASSLLAGHDDGVQTQQLQSAVKEDSQISGTTNTTMLAAADDASIVFSSNNNRVDMDMLNQAFLKGMEEAKKFLPVNTTLLTDTSMKGAKKKKKKAVEDLEGETGRKSKLMVPEPEQTGDEVDKIVTDGYALCLNEIESLSIAMSNKKKKKMNNTRTKGGRNEEAVDLQTLLLHCAQAVSMGDHLSATQLLGQIKQHSSPTGDANQRLAHCFAEGLQARLAGTGSELYRSAMARRTPAVEFLKAYVLYLAVSCFHMTAYGFSIMTVTKAIVGNGKKRLHIVDYGVQYGSQWPHLLYCLGKLEGGPPAVRMTCIDVPQPGFRPIAQIQETGHRLTNFARRCGVSSFSFHGIAAKWETVCAEDLDIDADEVLIVNNISSFGNLMDEGVDVDIPSPRDMVLRNIHKMRPHVFIQTVVNGLHNTPFFVTRFREALFYYSAFFDMLDAMAPRDNEQRLVVERDLIGRCAMNVIACEGMDRVERPETYRQWQARNRKAGLRQLPLCADTVKVCRQNVRKRYHKDFVIDVDHHWLLQGWKGRILYAMSTWAADDIAASEL